MDQAFENIKIKYIYFFTITFISLFILRTYLPKDIFKKKGIIVSILITFLPLVLVGFLHSAFYENVSQDIDYLTSYIYPKHKQSNKVLSSSISTAYIAAVAIGVLLVIDRIFVEDRLEIPLFEFFGILLGGIIYISLKG